MAWAQFAAQQNGYDSDEHFTVALKDTCYVTLASATTIRVFPAACLLVSTPLALHHHTTPNAAASIVQLIISFEQWRVLHSVMSSRNVFSYIQIVGFVAVY